MLNRRFLTAGRGGWNHPEEYETVRVLYTSGGYYTVPADDWYQMEAFGASGSGGRGISTQEAPFYRAGGGGGGGGGYACSRLWLRAGDVIRVQVTEQAGTVEISTTTGNSYTDLVVTAGEAGGDAAIYDYGQGLPHVDPGSGGNGGKASGGSYVNADGEDGQAGEADMFDTGYAPGGAGGIYGGLSYGAGGNTGGAGGSGTLDEDGAQGEEGSSFYCAIGRAKK